MCVMSAGSMHRLTSSTTPKTVTGCSTSIYIYTGSIIYIHIHGLYHLYTYTIIYIHIHRLYHLYKYTQALSSIYIYTGSIIYIHIHRLYMYLYIYTGSIIYIHIHRLYHLYTYTQALYVFIRRSLWLHKVKFIHDFMISIVPRWYTPLGK